MKKNKATEIKVALLRVGKTQAQIARELEVHIVSVNGVINGRCKSTRVMDYIEQLTGIRPEYHWEKCKKAA
jgi:DNA-binding transcriptional regulator YdaS (Cro superfamily)